MTDPSLDFQDKLNNTKNLAWALDLAIAGANQHGVSEDFANGLATLSASLTAKLDELHGDLNKLRSKKLLTTYADRAFLERTRNKNTRKAA